MNLIFKEYCDFLKEKTGLELDEGYYWLDNQIIKCFDKQGYLHKLYRLKVDDKLNISCIMPKNRGGMSMLMILRLNHGLIQSREMKNIYLI